MLLLKSYNFHKPKKLIHLFVLLILLAYCTKERNNPWDDKNTLKKDSWMVDNLKIDIFKIDSINLSWELKNDKIEGVRIDRKIDEQPWVTNYAQVPNNILNFIDTAVNLLNHKYHYRLYAYAGNNLSSSLDTAISKLIFEVKQSQLQPDSFSITFSRNLIFTNRGVVWDSLPNPTIANNNITKGSGVGNFNAKLVNYNFNTDYYVRAYVSNGTNVFYSNEIKVKFLKVNTTPITSITSSSAISGGEIISDDDIIITSRGVCWSTNTNPTIANNKTNNGTGKGIFTSNIPNLAANTTYYVRAYATSSVGIFYGNQISFKTTAQVTLASLSTTSITSITSSSAVSGGNITNDGGANVTASGVCWSTIQNPTIANNKTSNGSGTGNFTSNINGLSANTTYYVRAYATNSAGTAYGNQVSFTTLPPINLPTLSTTSITSITSSSAVSGGNVTNDGGANITARGICWSTNQNPTILNEKTTNGSGSGSFTSDLTGLTANTTYYVCAYATNSAGTGYGNQVSFTTSKIIIGNGVIDVDGNYYPTVIIGQQEWMAENLKVTKYKNGTSIPNITNNSQWSNLTSGAFCYYNHDKIKYEPKYGALYNWYVVSSGSLCPNGWHVPSNSEWNVLTNYLASNGNNGNEGKVLKSITSWNNGNGSNDFGFNGLPGGYIATVNGFPGFDDEGNDGLWWSTTAINNSAWNFFMNSTSGAYEGQSAKWLGLSVRCIKD